MVICISLYWNIFYLYFWSRMICKLCSFQCGINTRIWFNCQNKYYLSFNMKILSFIVGYFFMRLVVKTVCQRIMPWTIKDSVEYEQNIFIRFEMLTLLIVWTCVSGNSATSSPALCCLYQAPAELWSSRISDRQPEENNPTNLQRFSC